MSVVIKLSPTGSITGGTDHSFEDMGVSVPNGINIQDVTHASHLTRPQLTLRSIPGKNLGAGRWSKSKRTSSMIMPIVVDSGDIVNNAARLELEIHPETPDADIEALCLNIAQIAISSGFEKFRKLGSVEL